MNSLLPIAPALKNHHRTSRKTLARWILHHVFSFSNEFSSGQELSQSSLLQLRKHHFDKILAQLEQNAPLTFVLPAFPAKSPNRDKTTGDTPDMAEVLALQFLNRLCEEIQSAYTPGAKIIICSDGRVFSDLVLVDDACVDHYAEEIRRIIDEFQLRHLDTFNLEDVFPQLSYDQMRQHLSENYAVPVAQIREQIKSECDMKQLFNGIHRFIFEDRLALVDGSKNKIRNHAKEVAYQVIQRSNAWSQLVEEQFPEAVRLSIHPQIPGSKKIGIKMLDCDNIWGTPWHNVALFDGFGWSLVKRKHAEAQQGKLASFRGKYAYYVVSDREKQA